MVKIFRPAEQPTLQTVLKAANWIHLAPIRHWWHVFMTAPNQSSKSVKQGCKNTGHQVTMANKFCTVTPNMCGSSVWSLLQALRILRWLQKFCKICAALSQNVGTSRVAVRLLVSHEDLCHVDFITDVKYAREWVSSSMISRHQGRGRVWNQSRTHTHTHTQRAVHLKVDHTTAKERFLPITTACCSCLPVLAAITSLFRPTSLVHMQHAYCSFWFVS
jgi:hypothetical protein